MFEVDYGSGSVLGMEGVDNVSLAGLELSQVLFGLVLYEDQQVRGGEALLLSAARDVCVCGYFRPYCAFCGFFRALATLTHDAFDIE